MTGPRVSGPSSWVDKPDWDEDDWDQGEFFILSQLDGLENPEQVRDRILDLWRGRCTCRG